MILDLIKIDLVLGFLLFVPGYFVLIALTKNKNPLETLGTLVVSFVLSLGLLDFSLIIIDKIGFKIDFWTILTTLSSISIGGLLIFILNNKKTLPVRSELDKKAWLLFFLIVLLSVFIRASHLAPKMIPHTTDLGHHMYWANYIVKLQKLPVYGIPDVIIGEHVVFGAASILTGISVISALPIIILFIINIFSVLALFLLTKELASLFLSKKNSHLIGIFSLISIGIFYAVASPQATYINGGVVGNIIGNLLIPTILFLLVRAYKEKDSVLASLGFFSMGILVYTHHLSAFIFIYSLIGFLVLLFLMLGVTKLLTKKQSILKTVDFIKIYINLRTITTSILILILVFLVRIPSYLNLSAIDTAVGSPSKSTRVGLTINNLLSSTGPWRVFYSLVGAIFLTIIFWKIIRNKDSFLKTYSIVKKDLLGFLVAFSLSVSWFGVIFVMSHWPALLKIDIISGRIANYLTYPSALLASFGLYAILKPTFKKSKGIIKLTIFSVILIPGIISGLFDVSESYSENTKEIESTLQTFTGSEFLAQKTQPEEKILKDHIYLTGDTWIKNFLMRDYEEPLSRTLLKRYNDPVKERETCTRDMVAIPESEIAKKCFNETGVEFIILKNNYDTNQFENSNNFSKIFTTSEVVIFQRN